MGSPDAYRSVLGICNVLASDVDTASLSKLTVLYSRIFGQRLHEVIGRELSEDVHALAEIRNLVAHGRDYLLHLDHDEDTGEYVGDLSQSPLKTAAQRLRSLGLISEIRIDGRNHHEFLALFFSDPVVLHFYRAVSVAEERLYAAIDFPPETSAMARPHPLPVLDS